VFACLPRLDTPRPTRPVPAHLSFRGGTLRAMLGPCPDCTFHLTYKYVFVRGRCLIVLGVLTRFDESGPADPPMAVFGPFPLAAVPRQWRRLTVQGG